MTNSEAQFDRFDIAEANYIFCSLYHSGQNSNLYTRLSRVLGYFNPRDSLRNYDDLTDNGKIIFNELYHKHAITKNIRR